ncbi:MAG: histone deacetylase family protein, partial [Candidatus Odinarchaeia archaeon]
MKIVYHKKYEIEYTSDPAAESGRMEAIYNEIKNTYTFIEPRKAEEVDVNLIHTPTHIEYIKKLPFYDIILLAVGGAIKASQIALTGEPAFGLIRPPGHHASPDSCWGFCFFNNIAIAVEKLRANKQIEKAIIVDFDLHFGDGTDNAFDTIP